MLAILLTSGVYIVWYSTTCESIWWRCDPRKILFKPISATVKFPPFISTAPLRNKILAPTEMRWSLSGSTQRTKNAWSLVTISRLLKADEPKSSIHWGRPNPQVNKLLSHVIIVNDIILGDFPILCNAFWTVHRVAWRVIVNKNRKMQPRNILRHYQSICLINLELGIRINWPKTGWNGRFLFTWRSNFDLYKRR